MASWKCHFSGPSYFCCLSRLLSAAEPPRFRRYRFIRCFSSIAINAVKSEVAMLAKSSVWTVTISGGGPVQVMKLGSALGKRELFMVWMGSYM